MMQKLLFVLIFTTFVVTSKAQSIKLQSGIEYRYVKKGASTQTAKIGDFMTMIIKSTCSGQTLFDTRSFNKGVNSPVNFPLQKPKYNGDVMEVIGLLHEGDSVVVRIPQDSFYRVPQAQRKGLVAGEVVLYNIAVYDIKTPAQLKKLQEDYKKNMEMIAKQQATFKKQQEQQLLLQKQQAVLDKKQDKEILAYFVKNNIKNSKKLPSGVYVVIDNAGTGNLIKSGFEVTMNYENSSISDTKFDSNIDTAFHHVTPMKVNIGVGQRQLMTGWEEGIQQFKNGSKGKIFIPSKYAYGSTKFGLRPNDSIPANCIIKIDVEILDAIDIATAAKELAEKEDQEMLAYFAKNDIKNPKKLPSGVYVVIENAGTGNLIKTGYEVSMNYEKLSLSGTKFDSNLDTTYHHMNPMKVVVGTGKLVAGWDEAIQQFKKGGKGKIFVPSKYGFGSNKFGIWPNDTIPANTILKIDVEVLDVTDPALAAKQLVEKQDNEIKTFLKANNLKAVKTNSGLYYLITKEGTGNKPANGDEVTMNYTGMFLDGKKFDSNVDSAFSHVSPFKFPLGQGRVIRGWDEGVALLKKGTKAKFILPSAIAYGANGSGTIPANAVLQFDVELVEFKKPEAPKKPAAAPKKK
jgi:FKBP-type peptidyl-prolyl cis-trans isomerase